MTTTASWPAADRRATDRYLPALGVLCGGYMLFGKSFAYLGVPPLFVGEILLLLGIAALIASGCLTAVFATVPALCAVALMGWVLFRTVQGAGTYGVNAFRDGAVAIYALYALIAAGLLLERPARLTQVLAYLRVQSRILVPLALLAYIAARFVGTAMPSLPGQEFGILAVRSGELSTHLCAALVLVLLGLCRVGPVWILLTLAGAILMASQSRGGMLALAVPILFAIAVTGQIKRLAAIILILSLTLGIAALADVSIDIPRNERPISARAVVENLASVVVPSQADNLDGTKQWRLNWWNAIIGYTLHGPYFWTGKGFGPNLAEVDGFVVGLEWGGPVLRSPHSVHMTYLARSGVPGLALWLLTIGTWSASMLRSAHLASRRGDTGWSRVFILLVCYLASIVIDASFDVALEGPMLGIPFWVLFGVGIGASMIYRGMPAVERPPAAPLRRDASLAGVLAAAAMLFGQSDPASAAGCGPGAIRIAAGTAIQPVVTQAPPGARFCLGAGLHRAQRIAPKDRQIIEGEPGAVLSGAVVVTGAIRDGAYWRFRTATVAARRHGTCLPSRPLCNQPFRIFLDGQPLEPAATLAGLERGQFYRDSDSGETYLRDDPSGRLLEATREAYAIWNNGARDVVVRGLTVEKYATPAQQGAIFGDENARATGWLIENNEVRLNSGAGIATGDRAIVRGNRVHHNGQLGISPNGRDVLIEGNEIFANNTQGFDATWEAGGLKAGAATGMTLRGNRVHDNLGSGLWCDVDCKDVLIEGNIVERNADAGIFYEISSDAVIRGNTLAANGTGLGGQQGSRWFWGAGIQIAASRNVQVYGNTVDVADGGTGIILIDQGRVRRLGQLYRTAENVVRDNRVNYRGRGISGGASDVAEANPNFGIIQTAGNRFEGNVYSIPRSAVAPGFIWGRSPIDYAEFRLEGQEREGRLIETQLDHAD